MVKLPNRLEDLYPAGAIEKVLEVLQQPDLSGKVREAMDKVGLRDLNPVEQMQQAWHHARDWIESVAATGGAGNDRFMINATGQWLPSNDVAAPRPPISPAVARVAFEASTRYQIAGSDGAGPLSELMGRRSVVWLPSIRDALQIALAGRKVLIAKTDQVRIPGLGDIGSLLSGLDLVEVGAANGCTQSDWSDTLSTIAPTDCVILVVTPNVLDRESAEAQRAAALAASAERDVPVLELAVDAVLDPRVARQLDEEPLLDRVANQPQSFVFPLDLLIGGTGGAVIATSDDLATDWERSARVQGIALRAADRASAEYAARAATEGLELEGGLNGLLLASSENLKARAERIATQIDGELGNASATESDAVLGAAPWDRHQVKGWAVEIECESKEIAARYAQELLSGRMISLDGDLSDESTNLVGLACFQQDQTLRLDLRWVDPRLDHAIVQLCCAPKPSSDAPDDDSGEDESQADSATDS